MAELEKLVQSLNDRISNTESVETSGAKAALDDMLSKIEHKLSGIGPEIYGGANWINSDDPETDSSLSTLKHLFLRSNMSPGIKDRLTRLEGALNDLNAKLSAPNTVVVSSPISENSVTEGPVTSPMHSDMASELLASPLANLESLIKSLGHKIDAIEENVRAKPSKLEKATLLTGMTSTLNGIQASIKTLSDRIDEGLGGKSAMEKENEEDAEATALLATKIGNLESSMIGLGDKIKTLSMGNAESMQKAMDAGIQTEKNKGNVRLEEAINQMSSNMENLGEKLTHKQTSFDAEDPQRVEIIKAQAKLAAQMDAIQKGLSTLSTSLAIANTKAITSPAVNPVVTPVVTPVVLPVNNKAVSDVTDIAKNALHKAIQSFHKIADANNEASKAATHNAFKQIFNAHNSLGPVANPVISFNRFGNPLSLLSFSRPQNSMQSLVTVGANLNQPAVPAVPTINSPIASTISSVNSDPLNVADVAAGLNYMANLQHYPSNLLGTSLNGLGNLGLGGNLGLSNFYGGNGLGNPLTGRAKIAKKNFNRNQNSSSIKFKKAEKTLLSVGDRSSKHRAKRNLSAFETFNRTSSHQKSRKSKIDEYHRGSIKEISGTARNYVIRPYGTSKIFKNKFPENESVQSIPSDALKLFLTAIKNQLTEPDKTDKTNKTEKSGKTDNPIKTGATQNTLQMELPANRSSSTSTSNTTDSTLSESNSKKGTPNTVKSEYERLTSEQNLYPVPELKAANEQGTFIYIYISNSLLSLRMAIQ